MSKKAKQEPIKIGKIGSINTLKFRPMDKRDSIYDGIFEGLKSLKKGESFTVPLPKGVTARTMHNRVSAALRRGPVKPPTGCVFRKRTTLDDEIAIVCMGEDDAFKLTEQTEKKPAKKAKAKKSEAAQ